METFKPMVAMQMWHTKQVSTMYRDVQDILQPGGEKYMSIDKSTINDTITRR